MDRRYFLRFLGLAPLAAPVALIAAAAPADGAAPAGKIGALLADSPHSARIARIVAWARQIVEDAPVLSPPQTGASVVGDELHEWQPEGTLPPEKPIKVHTEYLVVDGSPLRGETRSIAKILADADRDEWEFLAVGGPYGDQYIFAKTRFET